MSRAAVRPLVVLADRASALILKCGLQAMARELHALRMHSSVVEPGQFRLPSRRATTAVTVAAHLLRGFL